MNGSVAIDVGSHDVSLSLQKLLNNNNSSSRWGRMQGRVVVFVYREKKQNISLIHKLVNRWRNASKIVLFTFLTQLMTLKRPATGLEKRQDWLTFKLAPSSGDILN